MNKPYIKLLNKTIAVLFISSAVLLFSSCVKEEESLSITYISHSSFILSNDSTSILIDPFMSRHWIGYSFPENISANATFITHPHYDHDGGRFLGEKPYWESKTTIYEQPGIFHVGKFEIEGFSGKHCDPYGKEFGQINTIWKINIAGISIVHLGDNGPLTEANYNELGKTDVLMIPIDSKYHIISKETIEEIISKLEPKLIIPMHYRISSLEEIDKPKNLGDIEPYLSEQPNVMRPESNIFRLSKNKLPKLPTYLKLQTYPGLKK